MGAREIARMVVNRVESIRTLKCTIVQKYDNTTETIYSVLKLPSKEYDRYSTGEIYIRNGSKCWDYYDGVWHEFNATGAVNKTKVYDVVLNLLKSNDLTFEGIKKYDNRTCYIIRLHNSTEDVEMWIDSKLLFPVLVRGYSNGQYGMIEFKNVQINVPVNDSLFSPPKNAKVVHENLKVTNGIRKESYPSNVEVLVWKGIERMNSKELSEYLGFTPVIPEGWKIACSNLYVHVNNSLQNEIDLICVNGSKPYKIVKDNSAPNSININYLTLYITEKPLTRAILETLSANNYTTIDSIKVYTIRLNNKTIPIGFSRSGIWYSVNWPYLNESEQIKIIRDLIEHPVTFDYRVPVSVTKVYEFNGTKNIEPFIEKYFKHKIILPYPYSKTLVEHKNNTNVFRVIVNLGGVDICNGSIIMEYTVIQSMYNISSGRTFPSWTTVSCLRVNESLKGKIPSDAKKIKLGTITVWVESDKCYTKVYTKRDGLLLTFASPVGVLSNEYLYKFVEYFLS